jgi:hypothetical protein
MGYQAAERTITLTTDGRRVMWLIDYTAKTFTAVAGGETLGTWATMRAGMQALGLIEVPAKRRS